MPRTIKINIILTEPRNPHAVPMRYYDVTCHYMSIYTENKNITEGYSDQTIHDYSMERIVKKILSKAKFNDSFIIGNHIYPDIHKEFKEILQKEINKPKYQMLNINIINQSDIIAQENRIKDAYQEQEKIIHRAQSAIKRITRFLWPIRLSAKPQNAISSKSKILEKVHNIEENLRITQLMGTLILLAGVILFLIVAATPFSLPLILTALGVTLMGSLVLASASGIGYKTGIFKSARETLRLSDDFLQESNITAPAALMDKRQSPAAETNTTNTKSAPILTTPPSEGLVYKNKFNKKK